MSAQRFLGLDLAGAKNTKTTLAILESYPNERKIFLLDVHEQLGAEESENPDRALIERIHASIPAKATLGTSAPLTLPPAIGCSCRKCGPGQCKSPASRWTLAYLKKVAARSKSQDLPKLRIFTPYTQRPLEVWARYEILPLVSARASIEIDETLGANKAPLAMRMIYLRKFLKNVECVEIWPKLTAWSLGKWLHLPARTVSGMRTLDEGVHAREEFLEALAKKENLFLYDKDARKLIHSLAAFDAFLCAYTALLCKSGRTLPHPKGFPVQSGWVEVPSTLQEEA